MRAILFILLPVVLSFVVTSPLLYAFSKANNRRALPMVLAAGFLYLSAVVGNVAEPGLNSILQGTFHSDIGFVGTVMRMLITLALYAFVIVSLSATMKFKSKRHTAVYILFSALIYGSLFDYFLRVF